MPRGRMAMESIEEILRLHHECKRSQREIARSCGLSAGAVNGLLQRAARAGLGWPLPECMEAGQLHERLYGRPAGGRRAERRGALDCAAMHKELSRRRHLTLRLLWEEYRAAQPDGYGYSQYCELYRQWKARRAPAMLQEHKAGEKLFVDYAGQTVPVRDPAGGAARAAQVFVAVLGASSYCYAEVGWGQGVESWIAAHVRALEHFGGSPELLVPDNLKSGVTRACRYEPVLNRSYKEMARHYGMAVVPARPYRPKDKAKAEAGVQLVERRVLEALRGRRFESLGECNAALGALLEGVNAQPFQKRPGTRRELFEELDRPALRPLPAQRYEYAAWLRARVNVDYHVAVDGHRYSVPCELLREEVEVRLTAGCVEVLHRSRRVALHARSRERGGFTTDAAHRPRSHREHGAWPPERMQAWAGAQGPHTAQLVGRLLEGAHPQERYGACLGIIRLAERCEAGRMEAAARRALHYGTASYAGVKAILASGADRLALEEAAPDAPDAHGNVRGGAYYGDPAAAAEGAPC